MSENPYQGLNLYEECLGRLEKAGKNFPYAPRRKYVEEVAAQMSKRLKLFEVDALLLDLHKRHENFPSMFTLEAEFKRFENKRWESANPNRTAIRKKNEPWVSQRAPGTPATAEVLFDMIRASRTETGAFQRARSLYAHLSDEQLWDCFGYWSQGKIHPLLKGDEENRKSLADAFKTGG